METTTWMYSCLFLRQKWFPEEVERREAKERLQAAILAYGDPIEQVLAGRSAEWVLMGKKHSHPQAEGGMHWTVRTFCGEHAVMTLDVYEDKEIPAEVYCNGGEWEAKRSRSDFMGRIW
ncbi:hypothetical protein Agabi119p4_9740 [Agaricus bisporus var. burnettii]|uniref:Uncharacterized protein n=1 Tax=Agaricus bisporus var. burnettii TaxID=192524 RepID=A0A8H7C480_AGABI|nr:hypothetical protein Agabi119p4_9740 [Agaricus bisporus var. burnettii]